MFHDEFSRIYILSTKTKISQKASLNSKYRLIPRYPLPTTTPPRAGSWCIISTTPTATGNASSNRSSPGAFPQSQWHARQESLPRGVGSAVEDKPASFSPVPRPPPITSTGCHKASLGEWVSQQPFYGQQPLRLPEAEPPRPEAGWTPPRGVAKKAPALLMVPPPTVMVGPPPPMLPLASPTPVCARCEGLASHQPADLKVSSVPKKQPKSGV